MTKLFAFLRALNLLEPGKRIISITKTAMWVCVIAVAYSTFTSGAVDLTSVLALFSTSALYAWRRYVQYKTGAVFPGDTPADNPDQP